MALAPRRAGRFGRRLQALASAILLSSCAAGQLHLDRNPSRETRIERGIGAAALMLIATAVLVGGFALGASQRNATSYNEREAIQAETTGVVLLGLLLEGGGVVAAVMARR